MMKDCNLCAEKCPQAERAHQAALGRMYAINELVPLLKKIESGELAPVVHGRWVFGTANHREWMKCSECLVSQTPTGVFTYCPNCGAKMDGKEDT